MNKIIVYAISKNGDGFVQEIGRFDSIEEIQIRCGLFSEDTLITFEEEEE
jgi:hypothetical protein